MLVSILMPLLNQACFLREALDSILAQSHSDLELIVIDGASTDGSLDILRDFELFNHVDNIYNSL